jgi:hypothetical protein
MGGCLERFDDSHSAENTIAKTSIRCDRVRKYYLGELAAIFAAIPTLWRSIPTTYS